MEDDKSSFTVFKSPPWCVPQSIKHVTFSEAFPAIGGLGVGRGRVKMALSRSLESIPENAVWHAGRLGLAAAGDVTRGPTLLPPIKRIVDGELPEMRARAFSDPNAYLSAASSRDRQQTAAAASWRTEGSGGRGAGDGKTATAAAVPAAAAAAPAPRAPVTPPPKKSPSPKQLRKTTSKRPPGLDSCGGDDGAAAAADFAGGPRLGARLVAPLGGNDRSPNALGADPTPPACTASGAKAATFAGGGAKVGGGGAFSGLSTGGLVTGGGNRGRPAGGMTAASLADLPSPPSPLAAPPKYLKGLSGVEEYGGGGSQPRIVHPPNVDKNSRSHLSRYLRQEKDGSADAAAAPRTAYALVGSPGRKRWPSPQRQATSFIAVRPSALASVASGGSHSYSGPMSPIARAAAAAGGERSCRSVDSGSGGSSSVASDDDDEDPTAFEPTAHSRRPERPAAAVDPQGGPAGSCSKEFQTILSGFFASGGSEPPSASRPISFGRPGEAFDDALTEPRAHFLRAGCRPVSDSP